MDKGNLGFIFLASIIGLVILAFVIHNAGAITFDGVEYDIEIGELSEEESKKGEFNLDDSKEPNPEEWTEKKLRLAILQQEVFQTYLLDHMDCIITTQYFWKVTNDPYYMPVFCEPKPMNYTGIWNPITPAP